MVKKNVERGCEWMAKCGEGRRIEKATGNVLCGKNKQTNKI